MTPTMLSQRIPEALPVDVDPPMVITPRGPDYPSSPETAEEGGGLKPLEYLRYRWPTVLFLGAMVGTVLAATAYYLIPAKYTTYSMIRVAQQDPRIYYNEDPQGRNDFASYLKTQAGVLRSHFVLTAALRDPEIAALPMLKKQDDPIRYLEEELQIDYSDGSQLIKPKLSGDDPKAITAIVNAIHRAYFNEIVQGERRNKQARLNTITKEIARMQGEFDKRKLEKDPTGDKPAETLPGVGPNLAASQVARLRDRCDSSEIRLKQLEDEKKRCLKKLENVEAEVPAPPVGYVTQLDADPAIASVTKQITLWQKQVKYHLSLNSNPDNPGIKELNKKIADATAERERIKKERIQEFRKTQVEETARRLKSDCEKIDIDVSTLKVVLAKATQDIKEYETKLVDLLPNEGPKDFLKVDTQSRGQIVEGLMGKANLLQLELAAPTRVESLQEAAIPMKKESKKQLMGTVAAALMGFMLVGLGVVAFESRVKRALSVSDVQKTTLGPILGAIPAVRENSTGADMALAEEAIETVRANLVQQFGRAGGRTIMVSSAIGDEGRLFLCRELALSLARSGGRTLLVDFDLRNPCLHDMFDVSNDIGFCDLLKGDTPLSEAAKVLPYGFALLPAGQFNDVLRQYLSFDRLSDILTTLRSQFDYVVLNSHPILSVAESAQAGRASDAVVLTVEKFESRLPLVKKAHEKIASLAPEAFGVVVLGASKDECLQ